MQHFPCRRPQIPFRNVTRNMARRTKEWPSIQTTRSKSSWAFIHPQMIQNQCPNPNDHMTCLLSMSWEVVLSWDNCFWQHGSYECNIRLLWGWSLSGCNQYSKLKPTPYYWWLLLLWERQKEITGGKKLDPKRFIWYCSEFLLVK